jgi:uncharacterized protein (TIGR00369 family)
MVWKGITTVREEAFGMATTNRERTIRWEDPARSARAFTDRSGLEIVRAMAQGSLAPPPMAVLMDLRFSEIGDGVVRFTMQPGEYMCNPLGFVHGGALATLLDTALTVCVFTKLAAGTSCTTTDLQLQFVRPIRGGLSGQDPSHGASSGDGLNRKNLRARDGRTGDPRDRGPYAALLV